MAAGVYTIICEQGASFRLDLTYTNNDGSPVHLAGYHAAMEVRRSRTSNSRLITQLSTDNGHIQIPAPETGEIRLALPADETSSLPPGEFFYDLVIWQDTIYENGERGKEVVRVIEGNFVVRERVTIV